MDEARVGAFICHCGSNIAGFLDVSEVTEYAKTLPHVIWAQDSLYTCSDSGRTEIVAAIAEHGLNRVVVASCTPRTHEPLFRATCQEAGLNPYLFEFVNIRDQCSWVHMEERERATTKAKDLLRMGIARAVLLQPREETEVEVVPAALVIGAGITGLNAALSLANRDFAVYLIEREPEMGGLLRGTHRLYPTGDDARGFIETKIEAVKRHPRIQVFTGAEVRDVKGFVGNYQVAVKQRRAGVEFELSVGTVIVATGARVFEPVGMYGYDGKRTITLRELDRLLAERMGSLGPNTKAVVMIQCVGSRNDERPYCSRICCMTAVRNAMWIKEADPSTQVYVLYRDMLTLGTTYEDLYREARGKGVVFIQYDPQVPPIVADGEPGTQTRQVIVYDKLLNQNIGIPCDLVVLSTPLIAQEGATNLAQMLKVPIGEDGFFLEAHVKLRPLDFATDGIYLCGCARFPASVGESISQAYGAAARASILLGRGVVQVEPIVSVVDEEKCIGCGLCETACPYSAMMLYDTGAGCKAQTVAASCKGCGVCGAGCPALAISMQHFTDQQLFAQIDAMTEPIPGIAVGRTV